MSTTGSERHAVCVFAEPQDAELLADRLFALGATAVSEEAVDGGVRLVADLEAQGIDQLEGTGVRVQVLERQDVWTHGWREHARSWRCGQHLVLRPAWLDPEPLGPGDVEVVVEPGAAFGSGSHPTTRLCLAAVEQLVRPGCTVLDVGSGSGVLGVAAALLGAGRVDAIDVDPDAVRATREVALMNGVGDRVAVSSRPLAQVEGSYDVVLANLLVPIVEDLGPDLVASLAPGGTLVLSGLLVHHEQRALAAVAPLVLARRDELDGWLALEARRGFHPPPHAGLDLAGARQRGRSDQLPDGASPLRQQQAQQQQ
jgi:ribosomal protein L11 methyltransferase